MTLQHKIQQTEVIADAIQRHEKIYRFDDREGLPCNILLPTPQVCGTSTQQRSYARDKAKEILAGL